MKTKLFWFFLILMILGFPAILPATTAEDYYNEGQVLYQQHQYDKALQYFQAAVQMDPQNWRAYQGMGVCYYELKQNDKAVEDFNRSLQINSDNPALKEFVSKMQKTSETTSSNKSTVTAAQKRLYPLDNKKLTLKFFWSLGYALLGNVDKDSRTTGFSPGGATAGGDFFHTMTAVGLEGDYSLDPSNGLGVRYQSILQPSFSSDIGSRNGTDSYYTAISFESGSVFSLKYFRYLPDSSGRWFIAPGADYYSGVGVDFVGTAVSGGTTVIQKGVVSGDTLGFSLEFGREFVLASWLGVDLAAQLRYADIPKLTGPYSGGSGTQALATSSTGGVGLVDVQSIQGNLKYEDIDLSGIGGSFNLNIYL